MDARSIKEDWWRTGSDAEPHCLLLPLGLGLRWAVGADEDLWLGQQTRPVDEDVFRLRPRPRRRGSNIIHARVGARQRLAFQLYTTASRPSRARCQ